MTAADDLATLRAAIEPGWLDYDYASAALARVEKEIARLRGGLEVIATTTYPARYLGETKDGTKMYGGSDDASRFARTLLDDGKKEMER